jgi:hypothetical protein
MEPNQGRVHPKVHARVKGRSIAFRDGQYYLARQVLSIPVKIMVRRAEILVLAMFASCGVSLALSNAAVSRSQDQPPKTEPKEKADPKGQTASLTGCVDEQEGKWVLVNDQTMAIIANLAADGFPTEGFAKYMGHQVTVQGTARSDGPGSTFKVRSIKTISETCAAR